MLNQENQTDIMKEIIENSIKWEMNLPYNVMKELEEAIINVGMFTKTMAEKEASGTSREEAMAWYFNQMSDKEKSKFMVELQLVGKYETLKQLHSKKNQ